MKAFIKSTYREYTVVAEFNKIILTNLDGYDGKKKKQLKSFLEDLQSCGCVSGMIGEFIYHSDCKDFYISNLDDLEDIRKDLEDSLGEPISNRYESPHYTFMCWLCFEEYCFDIYRNSFE